jgi:hypothetical protein
VSSEQSRALERFDEQWWSDGRWISESRIYSLRDQGVGLFVRFYSLRHRIFGRFDGRIGNGRNPIEKAIDQGIREERSTG